MRNLFRFCSAVAFAALVSAFLPSCLESDVEDYEDWRLENENYLDTVNLTDYETVVPDWAPMNRVYVRWHNDRALTASNLRPISTSTVRVKYEMEDINGTNLGNSYASTTYGDSIYQSTPNQNIIGFWAALTAMNVGDSVTMIIPYSSAYGSQARGNIKPYSNLIYHVKLTEVVAYEKPYE